MIYFGTNFWRFLVQTAEICMSFRAMPICVLNVFMADDLNTSLRILFPVFDDLQGAKCLIPQSLNFVESQNHLSLKGPLKVIWSTSSVMKREIYSQIRAPSSLTLTISRDRTSTIPLGNLYQCLTTLIIKSFSLYLV